MDLLAQDDTLALKSMRVQWVVQAFCKYIKDLGSFVARELLTTREEELIAEFIVATEARADVFRAVDAADLFTGAIEVRVFFLVVMEMVISLVAVESVGVSVAIDAVDLSTEASEEMVIF